MEVVLEDIPEDTFDDTVEVIVILEDEDGNKYYVDEDDEVQPLPEVDPESDVCSFFFRSVPFKNSDMKFYFSFFL